MNETTISRDSGRPFDIFVGTWVGTATAYDHQGKYVSNWSSKVEQYWNDDGTLRYEQSIDKLSEHFGKLPNGGDPTLLGLRDILGILERGESTKIVVDLKVDGKRVAGLSHDGEYRVLGQESAPGHYLFMIHHLRSTYIYSNNQYFVTPELRQIVGPTLASSLRPPTHTECPATLGLVQAVNVQTLTRISRGAIDRAIPPLPEAPRTKEEWQKALFRKAWTDEGFYAQLKNDRKAAVEKLARELKAGPEIISGQILADIINDTHDCPPPACC
jgi:hypothetical protein